jgi:hypothetical protein
MEDGMKTVAKIPVVLYIKDVLKKDDSVYGGILM